MFTTQAQIDADERYWNSQMQAAERAEDEAVARFKFDRDMALTGAAAAPRQPENGAQSGQLNFIEDLIRDLTRAGKPDVATTAQTWIAERRAEGKFDPKLASTCIDRLKGHLVGTPYERGARRTASTGPRFDRGEGIPEGYYAVGPESAPRFYRVTEGDNGVMWANPFNSNGRVKVRSSEVFRQIREQGIEESGDRFADLLDKCRDCGRPLTNAESRRLKRGPDCRAKRAREAALVLVVDDVPAAGGVGE